MAWPDAANPLWLAAGSDRSGERASALLALGFGGVDFGTVVPEACAHFPAAIALAARLAPFSQQTAARIKRPLISANLGIQPERSLDPARDWRRGIAACAPVADCLTLNLSGKTAAPLLTASATPQLLRGLRTARQTLDTGSAVNGKRPALAIKAAIDHCAQRLPEMIEEAMPDALVCVLDNCGDASLARFAELARRARAFGEAAPRLLAVGGVTRHRDLQRALAAGASAVQIHTAFARSGAVCISHILGNEATPPPGDLR